MLCFFWYFFQMENNLCTCTDPLDRGTYQASRLPKALGVRVWERAIPQLEVDGAAGPGGQMMGMTMGY